MQYLRKVSGRGHLAISLLELGYKNQRGQVLWYKLCLERNKFTSQKKITTCLRWKYITRTQIQHTKKGDSLVVRLQQGMMQSAFKKEAKMACTPSKVQRNTSILWGCLKHDYFLRFLCCCCFSSVLKVIGKDKWSWWMWVCYAKCYKITQSKWHLHCLFKRLNVSYY